MLCVDATSNFTKFQARPKVNKSEVFRGRGRTRFFNYHKMSQCRDSSCRLCCDLKHNRWVLADSRHGANTQRSRCGTYMQPVESPGLERSLLEHKGIYFKWSDSLQRDCSLHFKQVISAQICTFHSMFEQISKF